MFSTTITINNRTGLHARPASQLVTLCQKFDSEIRIIDGTVEADPKSIISILSAGIKQGTTIRLTADGPDEDAAGAELVAFIDSLIE